MFLLIDNFDSFTFNVVQAFQQCGHDPVVLKNDDPKILELAASGKLEKVCISPGPLWPMSSSASSAEFRPPGCRSAESSSTVLPRRSSRVPAKRASAAWLQSIRVWSRRTMTASGLVSKRIR